MSNEAKEIEWITTQQAAEIMGVSRENVQRHCKQTEGFECQRFGRDWMVSKASAEAYKKTVGGRGRKAKVVKEE